MKPLIESLKREGRLREQKVGFIQIEGLIREALIDLKEAHKTVAIADRATYLLAYGAMLKAGRALLYLEGVSTKGEGQHRTLIQVCEVLLSSEFKQVAQHFETMRRKRNELTYEYGGLLSHTEAEASLKDAEKWLRVIVKRIRAKNPQFSFKEFEKD